MNCEISQRWIGKKLIEFDIVDIVTETSIEIGAPKLKPYSKVIYIAALSSARSQCGMVGIHYRSRFSCSGIDLSLNYSKGSAKRPETAKGLEQALALVARHDAA
jgi:hypothetical protein